MDCEISKIIKECAIMTLTVPATPLPCALESAWQAHRGGSFFNKIVWYNSVVTALRKHPAAGIGFIPIPCFYGIMIMSSYAKVSGDHPWDFGSKAREPLVLKAPCLLICGIIVSIHYCEGGRQMASVKLLVKPESLCIPCGTHNKLTESRVSG